MSASIGWPKPVSAIADCAPFVATTALRRRQPAIQPGSWRRIARMAVRSSGPVWTTRRPSGLDDPAQLGPQAGVFSQARGLVRDVDTIH